MHAMPIELLLKQRRNIVVLGAGSIGAFVGGSLIASLADVSLIGRAAMHDRIRRHGLVMSGQHGWEARVPAGMVRYAETPVSLCTADLVIVAVKSSGTLEAAKQILSLAPRTALVASFQNGVDNLSVLRERLPRHTVVGAMVPFNVVQMDDGRLHRGTSGEIVVEAHPRWTAWVSTFRSATMDFEATGERVMKYLDPSMPSSSPVKKTNSTERLRRARSFFSSAAISSSTAQPEALSRAPL